MKSVLYWVNISVKARHKLKTQKIVVMMMIIIKMVVITMIMIIVSSLLTLTAWVESLLLRIIQMVGVICRSRRLDG